MGCASSSPDEDESRKKSKQIDLELGKHKKLLERDIKLLLLGTGESGKSTFFKQMKILSSNNRFTQEQLVAFTPGVHSNLITQMKALVQASENLGIKLDSSNLVHCNFILSHSDWSYEMGTHIKSLWSDKGIKETYSYRDKKFQLNDSANYFFDNIDRFLQSDYVPTQDDVLRVRIRSTGIEEAEFQIEDLKFRMIDVGGQRSERRKWIHCFDCVTAVIFCVALSEYDQFLREDEEVNRMQESITLFGGTCNIEYFWNTPFILFLNKLDLFEQKIQRVDLKSCFPEYEGGCNAEPAKEFIKERFTEKNNAPHAIYVHFTIAVDTKNVQFVFNCVRETLLRNVLGELF